MLSTLTVDSSQVPADRLRLAAVDSTDRQRVRQRRIIANDPDWTLSTVPDLVELTIRHIVDNFAS